MAAREWEDHPATGKRAEVAKAEAHALQIQKDECFWVAAALMSLFHSSGRQIVGILQRLVAQPEHVQGRLAPGDCPRSAQSGIPCGLRTATGEIYVLARFR